MADSYQQDLLASLLPQWQQLLKGWSADGSLVAAAQETLLLEGEPQALKDLVTQWSAGDFSGIPPIVLLSSSDISGAMGAYAISTGTIYLNQDWLLTATQDQVNAVLTEELGHHLDGLLNAVDTPGDEGKEIRQLLCNETNHSQDTGDSTGQVESGSVFLGKRIQAEFSSDITPPEVISYALSHYTLDLSAGDAVINVTARITDDVSGVFDGQSPTWFAGASQARWRSPSGQILEGGYFQDLYSGTRLDGQYTDQLRLSRFAENGTWTLEYFQVVDDAGNSRYYNTQELAELGIRTTLEVSGGISDTTAPILAGYQLSAYQIDLTNGDAVINVTARITDDASGVFDGQSPAWNGGASQARWRSPSGQILEGGYFQDLYSGTRLDGQYTDQLRLSRFAENGTWTLESFSVVDEAGNLRSYGAEELDGLGIRTTLEVSGGISDTTAPTLAGYQLSAYQIDLTNGDAVINVTARITDDVSGVFDGQSPAWNGGASQARWRSPSGQILEGGYFQDLYSGTRLDGQYTDQLRLSRFAENGTWTLEYFQVVDDAGNSRYYNTQELAELGIRTTLEVSGGTIGFDDPASGINDTTAPILAGYQLSAYQIDLTNGDAVINVTARITDDVSGVFDGQSPAWNAGASQARWRSPSGQILEGGYFQDLYSGTRLDGQYTDQLRLSRFAENGTWTLEYFQVVDDAGNSRYYNTQELAELGIRTTLEVSGGISDTTAPTLAGYQLSAYQIDLTNGDAVINVTARITDDVSGVFDGQSPAWNAGASQARWRSPSGQILEGGYFQDLYSGTRLDGQYTDQLRLSRFAENGTWTLESFSVVDEAGNLRSYGAEELDGLGIRTTLEVSGGISDTTAPTLAGYQLSAYQIDLTNGDAVINVTARITDDVSGVFDGQSPAWNAGASQARWRSPSGQILEGGYFQDLYSGTRLDGQYTDQLRLSRFAENGTWTLEYFQVVDDAGNSRYYNTQELAELGIRTTLEVTGSERKNSAPITLAMTGESINEISAVGTPIGELYATDPDSGTVFTYSLASGEGDTDNNLVEVIEDKVYVKSGAVIDFESNPTLDLRIQVTDNGTPALSYTKSFSVNVLNVQEDGSIGAITSLTPGTFKEGVTLTAGALTDPDGITGAVTYKWYNGATEVQSGASTTYEVGPLGEGTYSVDAVYVDGTGSTVTTSSTTQVVGKADNGQGSLSAITSSVPGTFQEGVRLTAGNITGDPDGNGTITGYQWYFNDVAITTNGTSSFYDVSNTGYGNYKVAVTYKDGQDYATTLTTANQVVSTFDNGNAAVSITGTATVGTTLTSSITTPDPDGNGSFTYQWQSFDGSTWSNISSATASTYQLTSNELTKQVRVVVTSTDAQAYGPIALYSNTTVPVVTPPDTILPTITDISVQGSNVILSFSEKVQSTGINNSTFVIKVGGTTRSVSATNYDSTNQNKVTLTLSGTAPASSTSLQVTYSATGSNIVKDLAGNSLGTFTNRSADTFLSGASVTSLYADYTNLTLTGTSAINGTGNAKNNTIIGNQANNTLNGAAGADVLTGAGGTDTFVYTTLTNSLLGSPTNYTFDRITDFAIGQDRIDGPKTASASQVLELGAVATLDQAGLQAVLTATKFVANGAASFTYNDNGTLRTFVALNNNVAGFDVTKDAVAEITGYSGLLTSLAIV